MKLDKEIYERMRDGMEDRDAIIPAMCAALGCTEVILNNWTRKTYNETIKDQIFKGLQWGRPRVKIDMDILRRACAESKNLEQAANMMGCNQDTITARLLEEEGITFSKFFKKYRGNYQLRLREEIDNQIFEMHIPSTTIFAAKNELGWTDKQENVSHIDDRRDPMSEAIASLSGGDEEDELESDSID